MTFERRLRTRSAGSMATMLAGAVAIAVMAAYPATFPEIPRSGSLGPVGVPTGSIVGTARYDGEPPEPAVFSMGEDTFCIGAHGSETVHSNRLVVNDDATLRWVFVYIREVIAGNLPVGAAEPVTLDKSGCAYRPHVLGMQAGATLRIVNSDPTLHTVQLVSADNPSFNIALPQPGMEIVRVMATPEVMIPVRCNVHPWTQAYIGVVPHAFFAVTGEQGSFVIDGVPAGEYVVEAWHELLGRQASRVTVTDGEAAEARFRFAPDRAENVRWLPEARQQD